MLKMKMHKEQLMQYNDEMEDKDFYNNLHAFHRDMEDLEADHRAYYKDDILKVVPRPVLADISYTIDLHMLNRSIYVDVLKAYEQLAILKKAELYAKDFKRDIEQLKRKVDFVARLSQEPIVIQLPKSKAYIKAIFYTRCKEQYIPIMKGNDIPDEAIAELFQAVFNEKLYKGSLQDVQQEMTADRENFFKVASYYTYGLKRELPKGLVDTGIYVGNPYTEEEMKELEKNKTASN